MARKTKTSVKINDTVSLEGLAQEVYNDACLQINSAQGVINELNVAVVPNDNIEDLAILAKEKGNLLKVKDSAIRLKLEIAKLQSDIIKNRGDINGTISERSNGSASVSDFKSIREMLKNKDNESEN